MGLSYDVYRSTLFDAPVGEVWAVIRGFEDWSGWVSAIESCKVEGDIPSGSLVGSVRSVTMRSGGVLRERLLGLSDHEHTITYAMEQTDTPMRDYVSTIRLLAVTDGDRTFAEWTGSFDAVPEQAAPIAEAMGAFYETAFTGVRSRLREPS